MSRWRSRYRVESRARDASRRGAWSRRLLEAAADALVVHDLDGRIVDVNEQTCRRLGYDREDLLGRLVSEIDGTYDHEQIVRAARRLDAGSPQTTESRHRRRDGSTFPVEVRLVRMDHDGRPLVVGFARDISDRKRSEEERVRYESRLRQTHKMEAVGTLASGVAHDVSNHLLAVRLHTELAMGGLAANSALRDNLDQVLQAVGQATELVGQLLTFGRPGAGKREAVRLPSLIAETLRLIRPTLPPAVQVATRFETREAVVAERSQMRQLVMNLVTNAVQAMPQGGVLDIELDTHGLGAGSKTLLPAGRYVVLRVSDTGVGMDAPTLERIFEPFFTTKEPGQGTGMGLAVVHGIAVAHGGSVAVESEQGGGTTFTVTLPAAEEARSLVPLGSSVAGGQRRARVLFVDDDYLVASAAEQALEMLGHEVTVRTHPGTALRELLEAPDRFDVVITDERMPNLKGTELAREVLRVRPTLPVVLCVAHGEDAAIDIALALGVRTCLRKPLGVDDFARALDEALGPTVGTRAGGD